MKLWTESDNLQRPYTLYKNASVLLTEVKLPRLPEEIEFAGHRLFVKDEFHITLLGVKFLAEKIDPDNPEHVKEQLIQEFEQFVAATPLDQYEITGPLHFVQDGKYKTIVAMADVPNIAELFDRLNQKFETELPRQQTHVTLYRFPKDFIGIPIPSAEELTRTSRPVELPELDQCYA